MDLSAFLYQRHRPEKSLLYQSVSKHYPVFRQQMAEEGRILPGYVRQEFEDYLKCGRLEHGFLRVRCETCHEGCLVAFSCKRRGFCPSCGARHMAESSALLVDELFPNQSVRQWVLSFPFQLRFLFASRPLITDQVLGSGQEGRLFEKDSPYWRGNVDPAVWFHTEPEYLLSYAVSGWGVCRPPRWISSISVGQSADNPGANSTSADYHPTSRTIS